MRPRLDVKLWLIASLAVFVLISITTYIARVIYFEPSVSADAAGTTDSMARLWVYLGRLVFSVMFAYVYTWGIGMKAAWMEGLRFGFWILLLISVPTFFHNLVMTKIPTEEAFFQMLHTGVEALLCGILVGWIYKPKAPAAA